MAHTTSHSSDLQRSFDAAVAFIRAAPADSAQLKLSNETKLTFYGLYKRAVEGVPSGQQPSMFDRVGVAKLAAWAKASAACPDSESAMRAYIIQLDSLAPGWRRAAASGYETPPSQSPMRPVGTAAAAAVPVEAAPVPTAAPHVTVAAVGDSVTPVSQAGAMYADFTAASGATTQPRTPSSATRQPAPSTTAAVAAPRSGGLLGWLLSPTSAAVRETIMTSSVASADGAAYAGVYVDAGDDDMDAVPRRSGAIRWSSSPNGVHRPGDSSLLDASMHTVSLPSGAASEAGDVGLTTPQHRAVRTRASLLQARLSHEELGVMCAELEVNLAEQQSRLEAVEAQLQSTWAAAGRFGEDALLFPPRDQQAAPSVLSRITRGALQLLTTIDAILARALPMLPHNSLRNVLLVLALFVLVRLHLLRRSQS